MIDQLWYTSSVSGLGTVGFRVRAASSALQDLRSERFHALDPLLRYQLPPQTNPYTITPEQTPVCLTFLEIRGEKVLLQKVYVAKDYMNRPGNYFVHLLTPLPDTFSLRDAIRLWRSPFWSTSAQALPAQQVTLPTLPVEELVPGSLGSDTFQPDIDPDFLQKAIHAYLTLEPGEQLFLMADPDDVAAVLWALGRVLPAQLLQELSFSTYEEDPLSSKARIVGTCWIPQQSGGRMADTPPFDLPAPCYEGQGLALNAYSGRHSVLRMTDGLIADFANFAARSLGTNQLALLDQIRQIVEEIGGTQQTFLLYYYILAEVENERPLTHRYLQDGLKEQRMAALLLKRRDIQETLLDQATGDPGWWQNSARPLLLRLHKGSEANSPLQAALAALSTRAQERLVEASKQRDVTRAERLWAAACDSNPELREADVCRGLLQALEGDPKVQAAPWPFRGWLLEKVARIWEQEGREIDHLTPWLRMRWSDLILFLDKGGPDSLRALAVRQVIEEDRGIRVALPNNLAEAMGRHEKIFQQALKELLFEDPAQMGREALMSFFEGLVKAGSPARLQVLLWFLAEAHVEQEFVTQLWDKASLTQDQEIFEIVEAESLRSHFLTLPPIPVFSKLIYRYLDRLLKHVERSQQPSTRELLNAWSQLRYKDYDPASSQRAERLLWLSRLLEAPSQLVSWTSDSKKIREAIQLLAEPQQAQLFALLTPQLAPLVQDSKALSNLHRNLTDNTINARWETEGDFWRLFEELLNHVSVTYHDKSPLLWPYVTFLLNGQRFVPDSDKERYLGILIKHATNTAVFELSDRVKGLPPAGWRVWEKQVTRQRSPGLLSKVLQKVKSSFSRSRPPNKRRG